MTEKLAPHIVMMPGGWTYGECKLCPRGWACNEKNGVDGDCPLAGARKAVEVDRDITVYAHVQANPHQVGSKPVTLYAVEAKP